jgi:hypothetical protein
LRSQVAKSALYRRTSRSKGRSPALLMDIPILEMGTGPVHKQPWTMESAPWLKTLSPKPSTLTRTRPGNTGRNTGHPPL